MTLLGRSSRKTPTVRISGGRRRVMLNTCCAAIWRGDGAKMKPTASAPMATASSASASLVVPQILTNTGPTVPACAYISVHAPDFGRLGRSADGGRVHGQPHRPAHPVDP